MVIHFSKIKHRCPLSPEILFTDSESPHQILIICKENSGTRGATTRKTHTSTVYTFD